MFKRFVELMMGKSEPSVSQPKAQPAKPGMADQHHYMFAHHVLPGLFFTDPQRFLSVMGSPNETDFLHFQWKQLSERATGAGAPVGLDYETRRLNDGTTIILVTMPLPTKATEAYYVAVVHRLQKAVTRR